MSAVAALMFRWETPPPALPSRPLGSTRRRPDAYTPVATRLRQHPDRWALVAEFPGPGATNLARSIRTGIASWAPIGAFEATSRKRGGVTRVYARYVGDPGQS